MIYVSLQTGEVVCFSFKKVYLWSLKWDLTQHNEHSHITSSHLHKPALCNNKDFGASLFQWGWLRYRWAGLGSKCCPTGFKCSLNSQQNRVPSLRRALFTTVLTYPIAHQLSPLLLRVLKSVCECIGKYTLIIFYYLCRCTQQHYEYTETKHKSSISVEMIHTWHAFYCTAHTHLIPPTKQNKVGWKENTNGVQPMASKRRFLTCKCTWWTSQTT